MKISKKEKEKIRSKIISSALELSERDGIARTTMSRIAREVGISESTIYNYFKTKEKIFLAYFEQTNLKVSAAIQKRDDISEYSLQEGLQLYIDLLLEEYQNYRKFMREFSDLVQSAPFSIMGEMLFLNDIVVRQLDFFFQQAITRGEIKNPPILNAIEKITADAIGAIIAFWVRDESENYQKSTTLIDLTLAFLVSILKSSILSHGADLILFFIRQQFGAFADSILKAKADHFNRVYPDGSSA